MGFLNSALLESCVIDKVADVGAAAQDEILSASVDMAGFDRVVFIVSWNAVVDTAVLTLRGQASENDSDWNDTDAVTPSHTGSTSSNKYQMLDYAIPHGKRYARAKVTRTTANATPGAIFAIRYRSKGADPVTQSDAQLISATIKGKSVLV